MTRPLDGAVFLVTGASQGTGQGIALELGEQGATVWLSARNGDALEATANQIGEMGGAAVARRCDTPTTIRWWRSSTSCGAMRAGWIYWSTWHNWLDARGYRSGVVNWRATTTEQPATPTVTVIDVDHIDEHFDPDQRVTADQRAAALLERQRHFAERNAL